MSWTKLDDGFCMHPKTLMAGNEIAGIFARCLSYCGKYQTDGRVPEQIALMVAGSKAKLEQTVAAGFLDRLPSGDLFIRDYAHYNPLRDEVEAKRQERSELAAKAAKTRWERERNAKP